MGKLEYINSLVLTYRCLAPTPLTTYMSERKTLRDLGTPATPSLCQYTHSLPTQDHLAPTSTIKYKSERDRYNHYLSRIIHCRLAPTSVIIYTSERETLTVPRTPADVSRGAPECYSFSAGWRPARTCRRHSPSRSHHPLTD